MCVYLLTLVFFFTAIVSVLANLYFDCLHVLRMKNTNQWFHSVFKSVGRVELCTVTLKNQTDIPVYPIGSLLFEDFE